MKRLSPTFLKHILYCIVIVLCLFGLGFGWIWINMRLPSYNSVEIPKATVNNDFNNVLCGAQLTQVGDTLYYYYVKDGFCHGLMEITSDQVTRIWGGGMIIDSSFPEYYMLKIRHQDDRVLTWNPSTEELYLYASETQSFTKFDNINKIPLRTLNYQQQENAFVHKKPIEQSTARDYVLCWHYKDRQGTVSDVSLFYVADNMLYYTTYNQQHDCVELIRFNLETEAIETLYQFKDIFIYHFIVEDEYIILSNESEVCIWDLDETDMTWAPLDNIVGKSQKIETNAYNRKVYIPHGKGLACYDLETHTQWSLYDDKAVDSCYIVDNTWVYFQQYETSEKLDPALYRIKQDGTCFEKVYG